MTVLPSLTRAQIRTRIARRAQDLTTLTATAVGSSTTFVDARKIYTGSAGFTGSEIAVKTGARATQYARITGTTEASNLVTFTPAMTGGFAVGDTAEVYNKRGYGFLKEEYDGAIGDAILDAYAKGFAMQTVVTSLTVPPYPEGYVLVGLDSLERVEFDDGSGEYRNVAKSRGFGGLGWSVIPASNTVYVNEPMVPAGAAIRFVGLGRHPVVDDDTDPISVPAEWLIARAIWHLYQGSTDRDQSRANWAMAAQAEATRLEPTLRTPRGPYATPMVG